MPRLNFFLILNSTWEFMGSDSHCLIDIPLPLSVRCITSKNYNTYYLKQLIFKVTWMSESVFFSKIVSECDQEIPKSQTADKPMAHLISLCVITLELSANTWNVLLHI